MKHWYTREGKPAYGKTLREAKAEKLYTSITEILKVEKNIGLDVWRENNLIKEALRSIAYPGLESFAIEDIKKRAAAYSKKPAKLGTVIHKMIERYLRGRPLFCHAGNPDVWTIFFHVKEWIQENVVEVIDIEKVFVNHNIGYAGKADLVARLKDGNIHIIDWKTQDVKHPGFYAKNPEKKKKDQVNYWPSFCRQLVALQQACDCNSYKLTSVVIGTNFDNYGVWAKTYSVEEEERAWECFYASYVLWKDANGWYDETTD